MICLFFTLIFWLLEQKPKLTKNIRDYLIKNQNQSKNLKLFKNQNQSPNQIYPNLETKTESKSHI
jgi:hypothetical protein